MAMLPKGFTAHSTEPKYEQSAKVSSEGRAGGAPKHNAEGYKSFEIGTYSDGWSDAAKSEDTKRGGTDHNTEKAYSEISLVINEQEAYSRDWSGK